MTSTGPVSASPVSSRGRAVTAAAGATTPSPATQGEAPARPERSSMTAADVEAYAGATLAGRRLYLYGSVGHAGGGPQ